MRYRGTLYVPGELSKEGLPVSVVLTDRHIELLAGDESLGRYPLFEANAERVAGDRFDLFLSGDRVVFEADDAIAFSYEAIPHITGSSASQISDRVRRWWSKRGDDGPADDTHELQSSSVSRIRDLPASNIASMTLVDDQPPRVGEVSESFAGVMVVGDDDDNPVVAVRSVREALGVPPAACPGLKADGELCGSVDLGPRGFCSIHDPDRIAERRLARERLEAAAVEAAHREVNVGLSDIVSRLEKAVVEVHEGTLDPERGVAMAALVEAMCEALARAD